MKMAKKLPKSAKEMRRCEFTRRMDVFRRQAELGNALAQVEYCITRALDYAHHPAQDLNAELADESVYDAVRRLWHAANNAGLIERPPLW